MLGGSLILFNVLVNNGIDVRPFLTSILSFGVLDAVFLGGSGLASILISWPPYKRRVFIHEAGHVLVGNLFLNFVFECITGPIILGIYVIIIITLLFGSISSWLSYPWCYFGSCTSHEVGHSRTSKIL